MGATAVGDEKVGTGALEIVRLRMDRQTPEGKSVLRQYALPGQVYEMQARETIELWAEWEGAVPTVIPANPKLVVDWGFREPGSPSSTDCGSCRLLHKYLKAGRFTVTVRLDDRTSTTVTRTFFLNVLDSEAPPSETPAPTPPPTPTPTPTPSPTPTPLPTLR